MNPLVEVGKLGQSIWYDNIRRAMLDNGELAAKIKDDGLRGMTSNPTIFEKAIAGSTDYNEAMRGLVSAGKSVTEIYEALAIEDIQRACDLFKPVYESTTKLDGYVSLEVSPLLAHDTDGTIAEAKRLWAAVNRPNLMVKIPATPAGLPAITAVIAAGVNVNVTMIFAQGNYEAVADAFIKGLEQRAAAGESVAGIASVASVFVSRIDSAIDSQLELRARRSEDEKEKAHLTGLLGQAAIANAKLMYQAFKQIFGGARFAALKAQGATVQRPLWASTGTKNPQYSDVLYLDALIGPHTVNTVPPATYTAFRDHGNVALTLETGLDEAKAALAAIAELGIDLGAVCQQLQDDGVKAFADSFDSLMASVRSKQATLTSGVNERMGISLGEFESSLRDALKRCESEQWVRKVWRKDAALWKSEEAHQKIIKNALGWVTVPELLDDNAEELAAFSARVRNDGFKHVMLLGMGGSSLCPEVFRRTFGKTAGFPELHVLDSTDPATVAAFEAQVDLPSTLCIVASKSGSTIEPLMFYKYFIHRMRELKADKAGENFVAITDPGTLMEASAKGDGFRRIFLNPADIGGRYSALSFFGMVPAALQGFDFKTLLQRAERAMHACAPPVPAAENPAARLGLALGVLANAGCDKLTLTTDAAIASLGLWVEQLVAESTGKEGKGIVPVAGEPLGAPEVYGNDRVFVHIAVGQIDADTDAKLNALQAAGHPVIRRTLNDTLDLGEEFYVWEMATALAGVLMEINPFDQPNVQESKDNTKALLEDFKRDGSLSEQSLAAEGDGLRIYADDETIAELGASLTPAAFIKAHINRAQAGDYVALLAYVQETEANDAALQAIRTIIHERHATTTTTGYGPRFLHSTGQLHKGGGDNGVFVQLTADDNPDIPLPGELFSFGVLKQAQALGDFQSLASRDRRAIRVHLGVNVEAGLQQLLNILQS
jgi:transaldolase/glucose-6-phosphate isomerase